MEINDLTARVIACVIRVHRTLGPGFVEKVYRRALIIEMRNRRLAFETEKIIPIYYERERIACHQLDILVEGKLIVELKVVDTLGKSQYAQVRSYLKAAKLETALLVNFGAERADFRRITSPNIPTSPK